MTFFKVSIRPETNPTTQHPFAIGSGCWWPLTLDRNIGLPGKLGMIYSNTEIRR